MDDHLRLASAASEPQTATAQEHAHGRSSAEGAPARPLTHGLFTLPEEEETVVRAHPARLLALSREPETKTVPVPRELLELSRREGVPTRAIQSRRVAEAELPVWDPWYGSAGFEAEGEEPVFELHARSQQPQESPNLDDTLSLKALTAARRGAARAAVLIFAALCILAVYWGVQ